MSFMSRSNRLHAAAHWFNGCLLILLLWIAGRRLGKVFPEFGALNSDAYWTYLPNARKLLEAPWTFLTSDPASYHVAPLGYIWPAIWGSDQQLTQLANCALFLACIVLIWSFVRRIGGTLAAAVACSILVGHPDIADHAAQVLTESLFLFGFSLSLFAIGQTIAQPERRRWLALMSLGLTITLLTRPVLQYMLLLALAVCIYLSLCGQLKRPARAITVALAMSLVLPAAVIVKNGVSFKVWSIGTGVGSGLFYGLSPHRNGAEPVYSNFSYDADVIPYVVDPSTKGHPLTKKSDAINQAVAMEVVKQTLWRDNAKFLASKLSMWLFTSTPELYINPTLRWIRLSEWMVITCCLGMFLLRNRRLGTIALPGEALSIKQKKLFFVTMLLGVLTMAVQLSPVLYNTRYASYFIEPWLMVLTGWSVGYLLLGTWWQGNRIWRYPVIVTALVLLVSAAHALTQHAVRREIWEIDARRPGPTAILLPATHFTLLHADGMQQTGEGSWEITSIPATFRIAVHGGHIPTHEQVRDAMWRMRFAIQVQDSKPSSQCAKALLSVAPHQQQEGWYEPPPLIFLRTDGQEHDYMIAANRASRPSEGGEVSLTFHCPIGSRLIWHGIELRRSTLTEAGIDFLRNGTPIHPYLSSPLTKSP